MTSPFATMPKVELHLHLEGAIPLPAMWELVERHGGDPSVTTPDDLVDRFAYTSFAHFIDTWVWKNRFLDTYEAFEFAAAAVARHLVEQHIVYAEAFFSPTDFGNFGLAPAELALAIRRGLDQVAGTEIALVVDLVRDTGSERAARTFDQVAEVASDAGIIGVGIGGSEAEYPPELFTAVYRRAGQRGFRLTAHAGEAAGAPSVWGALRSLGVERIGHGVRSVEDSALVEHLVDKRIVLEVCPTSNLRTGVVADWEAHPARTLITAGALVTINTDDPAMFHCSLAGEYDQLVSRFGLDRNAVRRIASNAIDGSWASETTRQRLHNDQDAWWSSAASEAG